MILLLVDIKNSNYIEYPYYYSKVFCATQKHQCGYYS